MLETKNKFNLKNQRTTDLQIVEDNFFKWTNSNHYRTSSNDMSFKVRIQNGATYLFEGSFTINRIDYKVGGGSLVLADDVKVKLKVQAVPQ